METARVGKREPDSERILLDPGDGSEDRLIVELSRSNTGRATDRPLIVVVHGLTGCAGSSYVVRTAGHFLSLGYNVVRVNLRGAGPSRQTCGGFYHAGRADDIDAMLTGLMRHDDSLFQMGCVLIGYSLGGSIVLNYLIGKAGRETPVIAAATVSTPIDLAKTSETFRQPRNRVYQKWLLDRMKQEVLGGHLTAIEQQAVRNARNVFDFDDAFVGPYFGFGDAPAYYRACSANNRLSGIDRPALLVHATNDPWVPVEPYLAADWTSAPCARPVIVSGGGHVGFHESGKLAPWHDRYIASWIQSDIAPARE